VKQSEIDSGEVAGTTSEDKARIKVLTQENRELRRAKSMSRLLLMLVGVVVLLVMQRSAPFQYRMTV
jgi:hypothetical protein